ncbi:MAG TPA: hypothetical protein PKY99_12915 [Turneriella sp.]|nr:hypothetical protein [Turneriella sp.]
MASMAVAVLVFPEDFDVGAAAYRAILADLTRLGEGCSAQYGFVCEHDYQAGERWLENEVLSPLLAQDMEALGRIVARQVLIEASAR